ASRGPGTRREEIRVAWVAREDPLPVDSTARPRSRFRERRRLARCVRSRDLPRSPFHRILTGMSRSLLPARVERYVTRELSRETPLQQRLRDETARMPHGGMQIDADQGALLALLVRSIGAKRAVEIGTFTGYSSLAVALALPADGKLVCCDVSEEWTAIARRYWNEAGL